MANDVFDQRPQVSMLSLLGNLILIIEQACCKSHPMRPTLDIFCMVLTFSSYLFTVVSGHIVDWISSILLFG